MQLFLVAVDMGVEDKVEETMKNCDVFTTLELAKSFATATIKDLLSGKTAVEWEHLGDWHQGTVTLDGESVDINFYVRELTLDRPQ